MDPNKNRKHTDSALNEDPSSGDGAVPNWREGLSQNLRIENIAFIAQGLHKNDYGEIPFIIATAKTFEGWFYMEAISEYDYLTRVSDYIRGIQRTRESFQAAPMNLTSQMDRDFFRKLLIEDITVNIEYLSDGNTVLGPPSSTAAAAATVRHTN